jgi:hypothetical protein
VFANSGAFDGFGAEGLSSLYHDWDSGGRRASAQEQERLAFEKDVGELRELIDKGKRKEGKK